MRSLGCKARGLDFALVVRPPRFLSRGLSHLHNFSHLGVSGSSSILCAPWAES